MGYFLIGLLFFAAWITHIVSCITHAAYVLLLAGAFMPPIGVIHGVMVWFGYGWA